MPPLGAAGSSYALANGRPHNEQVARGRQRRAEAVTRRRTQQRRLELPGAAVINVNGAGVDAVGVVARIGDGDVLSDLRDRKTHLVARGGCGIRKAPSRSLPRVGPGRSGTD